MYSDRTIKPRPCPPLCWQMHRCLAVPVSTLQLWVHCPMASDGLLPPRLYLPSGRTPLLRSSPLRTVLKTFTIYGSSPSNALLRKTRFRDGKMEAMNLVAALWVKKNAVRSPFRAAHHQGDAIMKSPSGETGDFLTAYGTTSVLVMPEKAKHVRTPKGISHIGPFTIGEVGFIRGIIRVGFASDFNVSFNGCTTGR